MSQLVLPRPAYLKVHIIYIIYAYNMKNNMDIHWPKPDPKPDPKPFGLNNYDAYDILCDMSLEM